MYQKRYTIMYDIANNKRRSAVVKYLEQNAFRIQRSVFLFRGTEKAVRKICDDLTQWIDPSADLLCCYQIHTTAIMDIGPSLLRSHYFID